MGNGSSDTTDPSATTDDPPKADPSAPVQRMRERLGSLPEIVALHGPPPSVGRPRAESVSASIDTSKDEDLNRARRDVRVTLEHLEGIIAKCERGLGADLLAKRRVELEALKKRVPTDELDREKQLAGLNTVQDEIDNTLKSITATEQRFLDAKTAQDKFLQGNKVPAYGGGREKAAAKLEREFKQLVTYPADSLMKRVSTDVRPGADVPERLAADMAKLSSELLHVGLMYGKRAEGISQSRHPHMHKLYNDYAATAQALSNDLGKILTNGVGEDTKEFRKRKQGVVAELDQLDKTVALWARIDAKEQKTRGDAAALLRGELDTITKDFESSGDKPVALSACDELQARVRLAAKGAFDSKHARDSLDSAVGGIRAKGMSAEDHDFIKDAMKARFGLRTFDGDLSKTNVVAFYNAFKRVPDSHTRSNEWLTDVSRNKSLEDLTSFYQASESDGKPVGKVVIKAMRTSGPLTVLQNDILGQVLPKNIVGSKRLDQFTWVTLHEIGHAVDESERFMERNGKDYGGWAKHSKQSVERMMAKRFAAQAKAPLPFAAAYVRAVIDGHDPSKTDEVQQAWGAAKTLAATPPSNHTLAAHPALVAARAARDKCEAEGWPDDPADNDHQKQLAATPSGGDPALDAVAERIWKAMLATHQPVDELIDEELSGLAAATGAGDNPNWNALAKAPILAWHHNCRLKETNNFLKDVIKMVGGRDPWVRAGSFTLDDGRNWHEAYAGDWYSYDPQALDGRVSNYQMRAPGEFFAEAYAAYYLEKLPKTNRLFDALEQLNKKDELANIKG